MLPTHARAVKSSSRAPPTHELPEALLDVENAMDRLKNHVRDGTLSQSVRRRINALHVMVQSLRVVVDEELKAKNAEPVLPPAPSRMERTEFNCVDTAMEEMKKRIRAERKRIVADTDATESESEQRKKSQSSISTPAQLENSSTSKSESGLKKKRKRIIHMSGSSDDEKVPPPKLKIQPLSTADEDTDTDVEQNSSNDTAALSTNTVTENVIKVEPTENQSLQEDIEMLGGGDETEDENPSHADAEDSLLDTSTQSLESQDHAVSNESTSQQLPVIPITADIPSASSSSVGDNSPPTKELSRISVQPTPEVSPSRSPVRQLLDAAPPSAVDKHLAANLGNVVDLSDSSSSSDDSSHDVRKKRVSVWNLATSTAPASSNSSNSSSEDEDSDGPETNAQALSRTVTPLQKRALWPNLDRYYTMLLDPVPPPFLPKGYVFPMTYPTIMDYEKALKKAILQESLNLFDPRGKSPSIVGRNISVVSVSRFNDTLQSVVFRLPKSVTLQSHDILQLEASTSRNRFPGIAVSTQLTQDDFIVLVSTAYSIDVLASFTLINVGNLITSSREYQAVLSLPSWPRHLQDIITSATIPKAKSLGTLPTTLISKLQKKFNSQQFKAIQMAIHQPITLIQGPPGTGKTHTILGIIQSLLQQPSSRRARISVGAALGVDTQPKIRLLVTAPSNAAVNVILYRMQAIHPDINMIRLGQPSSPSLVWLENLLDQDKNRKKADFNAQEARERLLDAAQIVFCTLSGAGSWAMWNPKQSHFDAVIVDEAAQATEASSLIPLRFNAQRYIFVGDHKQLPATILSTQLTRMEYDQSLFQRLVCNPNNPAIMLREQYRMHPAIAAFPSSMFYYNELVNASNLESEMIYHSRGFPPYCFYDVTDGSQSRVETTYRNLPEVEFIATRLRALLEVPYDFRNKIGIISPYKGQIEAIKAALAAAKLTKAKIEVNTVDGFQGREKEIIIVSCVRTLKSGDNSFWGDVRRMNVSLTRAISSCWVVGNSALLKESPAWDQLVEDCKRRNAYERVVVKRPVT
ncbi:hypothetical protein LEN26_012804 [Aphanomyces euteiches]|nr:hypothetical protein AeMF1_016777 [Aphanomyces euteiches]KAH9117150.1 hypothetical protein LEN26_012804 [Aphanomyces euteiches]